MWMKLEARYSAQTIWEAGSRFLASGKNEMRAWRSKSKMLFKPLTSDDPRQRQPDIALAEKVLDWVTRRWARGGT